MKKGYLASLLLIAACNGLVSSGGATDDGGDGSGSDLAGSPRRDGGAGGPADLNFPPNSDLAPLPNADLAMPQQGGPVGPKGGTVNLLHFGITGDTRPAACEDTASYPIPVINAIADAFQQRKVQFGLDLGDHMYVCNGSLPLAQTHMGIYMKAIARYNGTFFMTMGNHECYQGPCYLNSQNANYVAYMQSLAPIAGKPYYSFDVQTSLGKATFVVVADNAFDQAQANWLDATLATADGSAKYTIVARHHPEGDTTVATNATSMQIIRAHKFALFLTGHSHLYKHMTTDNGRDIVLGTGGAPLIAGGSFHGYAIIDQLANGQLQVTVYDLQAQNPVDSWTVGPNQ